MTLTDPQARRERIAHLRTIWRGMKQRCLSPNHVSYPRYGGRGIAICDRWLDFDNFMEDMGLRPSPDHSIDRIDNARGYEPGNCRWATREEQVNKRRDSRFVTLNGKTKTATQWGQEVGLDRRVIHKRLNSGLPPELALNPNLKPSKAADDGRYVSYAKRLLGRS